MSRIFDLDEDACAKLLHAGVFGRVSFATPYGPELLPVNYTTVGDVILVRTIPGSLLTRYADGALVAFETDYVNHERWHGWSVIARGVGECLDESQLTAAERAVPEPQPWARRDESVWFRLHWTALSGRQIGQGWNPLAELPVRRMVWS